MTTLLQKLDHHAKNWIAMLDSQLQQPAVQILTGDVFTHETASPHNSVTVQPAEPVVHPAQATDSTGSSEPCPPEPRKVRQGLRATSIRQRA